MHSVDTVVVGGGLAGLICGTHLADRGRKVVVLEAGERLGGRAQSWRDDALGVDVDLGPHILLSTYPRMLAWLERLGTADRIHWLDQGPDRGVMIRKMRGTKEELLKFSPLPPPFHFLPSLIASRRMGLEDVLSHRRLFARAFDPGGGLPRVR